jgi:GNAT superfamily N-acetyltransferase
MDELFTYSISTDKSKLDLQMIHEFLSNSYWSKDIPMGIIKRSIENSLCFGLYLHDRQIGFARVITDYATFGYLADVFIIESQRGKGLSKKLMEQIMSHPQLQGLRFFGLRTRDAHALYLKFGFTPIDKPENFMGIRKDNIYSAGS